MASSAAFDQAADREMGGITAELRRVRQAPKVRAVKPQLHQVGLGFQDEGQILRIVVLGPMREHPRELDPRAGLIRGGGRNNARSGNGGQQGDSGHRAGFHNAGVISPAMLPVANARCNSRRAGNSRTPALTGLGSP